MRSTGITVSTPGGSAAPVMIATQLFVVRDAEALATGTLRADHPEAAHAGRDRRMADCDAVHGDAVEGRLVALGGDGLTQHFAVGAVDGYAFGAPVGHAREYQFSGFGDIDAAPRAVAAHSAALRACSCASGCLLSHYGLDLRQYRQRDALG